MGRKGTGIGIAAALCGMLGGCGNFGPDLATDAIPAGPASAAAPAASHPGTTLAADATSAENDALLKQVLTLALDRSYRSERLTVIQLTVAQTSLGSVYTFNAVLGQQGNSLIAEQVTGTYDAWHRTMHETMEKEIPFPTP